MALGLRPPCLAHMDNVHRQWVTLQPNRRVSMVIGLMVFIENTLRYWRWCENSLSVSSPDNGVIVPFFLWLVTSSMVFSGCHMALRATYGKTVNTPFMGVPQIHQPTRMWVIILKGMEMKGNTVCDKVSGVSASLGPLRSRPPTVPLVCDFFVPHPYLTSRVHCVDPEFENRITLKEYAP